jgi:SAM-dependent methyltransferase
VDNARVYDAHYHRKRASGLPGWFDSQGIADVVSKLKARLARLESLGSKVLEVGCGAGDQSIALSQMGFCVTGVDVSPTAIEWAKEKADANGLTIAFLEGDVRDLHAFPDNDFDWVLDGCCWHFICERREAFLQSVLRVLKPAGLFMAQSVCGEPEPMPGMEYDREKRMQYIDGAPVTYFGEPETLLDSLTETGFEILKWEVAPAIAGKSCAQLVVDATKPR